MIDTDTRQLKRNSEGLYRSGGGRIPCDHCARTTDCPLKPRDACEFFMPALPFNDETGLRKIANTVRIGVAWTQRLDVGQVIALYNVRDKEIFGHARVVGMARGIIKPMLKVHAHANHLMLDTQPEQAADKLFAWLRQQYGPRIVHEDAKLTALYLLRLYEPPSSPNFKGHEALRSAEGGTESAGEDPGDGDGHTLPAG